MTIKSALISVYSKDGIDELALSLAKNGVILYSTGGTKKYLEGLGLTVLAVEDYTNIPRSVWGQSKNIASCHFWGYTVPKRK